MLYIPGEDRYYLFFLSLSIVIGCLCQTFALQLASFEFFFIITLVGIGSAAPSAYNVSMHMWQEMFTNVYHKLGGQSSAQKWMDRFNFASSILGSLILFLLAAIRNEKFMNENAVAILLSLVGGCFLGYGLAQFKIICTYKMLPQGFGKKNYNYLVPLLVILFLSQLLIPLFMF